MHVAIQVDDPVLTEAFKSYIERRLRFALGRFGGRVSQIAVRVGADGHNSRRCRIMAEALPFGRVAVEESDTDLFAAVDRATGRIGRLFGRELERFRSSRLSRDSIRTAA